MKKIAILILGVTLLTTIPVVANTSVYCRAGFDIPASSDGLHNDKLLRYFSVYTQNSINLNKFTMIYDMLNSTSEEFFLSSTLGQIIINSASVNIEKNGLEILTFPLVSKDIYEYESSHTYCSFYNPVTCTTETFVGQCTTDINLLSTLTYRLL